MAEELDVEALLEASMDGKEIPEPVIDQNKGNAQPAVVDAQRGADWKENSSRHAHDDRDRDRDKDRHRKRRSRSRSPPGRGGRSSSSSSRRRSRSRSKSPHRKSSRHDRGDRDFRSRRSKERDEEHDKEKRKRDRIQERERFDSALTQIERDQMEAERDQRTVFAFNLALRADEDAIYQFFSQAGKVRDVRLITDRNSRKSKGFGYIEYYDKANVGSSLQLSGKPLMGQIVQVQPTQAEKNRVVTTTTFTSTTTFGPTRLYVGSLHFNITEEDLRQVFAPFGEIEFINLHVDPETGRSKGFGFVQYRRPEDAKKALGQVNGLEIAGRQIKVGLVNDSKQDAPGMLGELDDDDSGGFTLNAQSRALLMAKLQRTSLSSASAPKEPEPAPVLPTAAPSMIAMSPCVLLKNMFDPTEETEPNWDVDIREDVHKECSKFGSIIHIHVDKESNGHVYIKFGSIPGAQNAINTLNKRWFAGKMITADFVAEPKYYNYFPEAKQ